MDMNHKSSSTRATGNSSGHPAGIIASLDSIRLKAAPIEPAWVLKGRPEARSGAHSMSGDGGSSTNVWDCSAGAFKWYFGWAETVLILDGSVRVTSPAGRTTLLKPNDVAYFAAGSTWIWEVDSYVRKLAFMHRPASRIERFAREIRVKMQTHRTAIRMAISIAVAAAASAAAISAFE